MWQTGPAARLRAWLELAPGTPLPRRQSNWQLLAALRFFLAFVVLCGHLSWYAAETIPWAHAFDMFGGKAAVIGFLLVSGYSISASLSSGRGGFYRRRMLRIYPLYLFAILFAVVLELFAFGPVSLPRGQTIEPTGWLVAAGNFLLLQTFVVKPVGFNGPVWSLAVEVFFYLLAPLFVRLRRGPLLALIIISAVCYALPKHDDWGTVYYVLSKLNALRYMWCWLLGFLLYRDRSPLTLSVAALGTLLIVISPDTPEPLCVVTYALSAGFLLLNERTKLATSAPFASNYLGDLSYPLYLFHVPAFILGYGFLGIRQPALLLLLALLVTGVALHSIDRFLKRTVLEPWVLGRPRRVVPIATPASE